MQKNIPRIAIIGMGGYAARHHEAVSILEAEGLCRLVAACDPRPEAFAREVASWRLAERGVTPQRDYRAMLTDHAGRLDIVVIPTPIALHAEMHGAAIEAGAAVYLEKPPTLDPAELEQMIERDRKARAPTLVGFNFIGEAERARLKRRLIGGEFGALLSVRLLGLWGRSSAYYGRNDWAGRLLGRDGRLLLDSCLGNGLSHHAHNVLHWAGLERLESWAMPERVRASLLRAHPIDGPDTVFLSAETSSGVPLRMALSHACDGPEVHRETLVCELAEIDYITNRHAVVRWRDGRTQLSALGAHDAQVENMRALIACLRGERARPPTTLADSRAFVRLHALAYVAGGRIEAWDEALVDRETTESGAVFLPVRGLREKAERFLAESVWPAGEPGAATVRELGRLDEVVRAMARTDRALARA